jgi:hypothetical protein
MMKTVQGMSRRENNKMNVLQKCVNRPATHKKEGWCRLVWVVWVCGGGGGGGGKKKKKKKKKKKPRQLIIK